MNLVLQQKVEELGLCFPNTNSMINWPTCGQIDEVNEPGGKLMGASYPDAH